MGGSTKERLIVAASALLDAGGLEAVTLRAVAEKVGVSHNAPYKHFRDRSSLLAGVATRDFDDLNQAFRAAGKDEADAGTALRRALQSFVDYALAHPSRYRLLFSDPSLPQDVDLKSAALGSFMTITQIISRCQEGGALPVGDAVRLGGLIYATVHGAIDLHIGGRASGDKGLGEVTDTVAHLLALLGADADAKASPRGTRRAAL